MFGRHRCRQYRVGMAVAQTLGGIPGATLGEGGGTRLWALLGPGDGRGHEMGTWRGSTVGMLVVGVGWIQDGHNIVLFALVWVVTRRALWAIRRTLSWRGPVHPAKCSVES